MNLIRNLIAVSSLLFVVLGASVAHAAATPAQQRAPLSSALLALGSEANTRPTVESARQEDAKLAQREQAAPELRNFQGGRVYLYLGGGATLVLVLLLLIILL